MDKKELSKLKRSLLALGMAGIILGTSGCGDNDDKEITREEVPSEYYNFDKYCKYVIKDGEALQLYNSQNIMLFYNKETYDVKEYIYNRKRNIKFFISFTNITIVTNSIIFNTFFRNCYFIFLTIKVVS